MRVHDSIACLLLASALALPAPAFAQPEAAAAEQIATPTDEAFATFGSEGPERAEPLFARVVQLSRSLQGERHPDTITGLANHAYVLMTLGRLGEAESLYARVLSLSRGVLGEKHPDTLLAMSNYASLLVDLDRPDEAAPLYADALRLGREVLGERRRSPRASRARLTCS